MDINWKWLIFVFTGIILMLLALRAMTPSIVAVAQAGSIGAGLGSLVLGAGVFGGIIFIVMLANLIFGPLISKD